MKHTISLLALGLLAACQHLSAADNPAHDHAAMADTANEAEALYDADKIELMNKTALPVGAYASPPDPHYGPESGSIVFTDTDPGPTIGGVLTMKPAIDESGVRIDEAANGITTYMIHWGLEVGEPGTADDAGNGDLGGDCMGFRDTGHVVMMSAADAGDTMSWTIPEGTEVPDNAVYFVGHTLYGDIHNLAKCTQTPIVNLRE
ncbi:MAG: hypothetical protein AAFW65_01585 [Pseudomonadota bacterium]